MISVPSLGSELVQQKMPFLFKVYFFCEILIYARQHELARRAEPERPLFHPYA